MVDDEESETGDSMKCSRCGNEVRPDQTRVMLAEAGSIIDVVCLDCDQKAVKFAVEQMPNHILPGIPITYASLLAEIQLDICLATMLPPRRLPANLSDCFKGSADPFRL